MGPKYNPKPLAQLVLGHLAVQQPHKLLELPRRFAVNLLSQEVEGDEGEDQPMKGYQIPDDFPIQVLTLRFGLAMSVPKYPTTLQELSTILAAISKLRESINSGYYAAEDLKYCRCLTYILNGYETLERTLISQEETAEASKDYFFRYFRMTFTGLLDCMHKRLHRVVWE